MKLLTMATVMLCCATLTAVEVCAQMYDDGYGGGGGPGYGSYAPQFNPSLVMPSQLPARGGCGPGCGGGGGAAGNVPAQANLPSGAVFAYLMHEAANQHYLQNQWSREQGYQHDAWANHLQYLQLQQIWDQQRRERDRLGGGFAPCGGGGYPVAYGGYAGAPPIHVDVNLVRRRRARCIGIGSAGGY